MVRGRDVNGRDLLGTDLGGRYGHRRGRTGQDETDMYRRDGRDVYCAEREKDSALMGQRSQIAKTRMRLAINLSN